MNRWFAADPKSIATTTGAPRATGAGGSTDRRATRITIAMAGVVIALAGVEHGVGEIAQGNRRPVGLLIESWPDVDAFDILNGEPAFTILPNLLATGSVAIVASLAYLLVVTRRLRHRHGARLLALLAVAMFLFGAGIFPPVLALLLAGRATVITKPVSAAVAHRSTPAQRTLACAWPWVLGADLAAWVALLPGVVLLSWWIGADAVPVAFVMAVVVAAIGLLAFALVAAAASDREQAPSSTPA